MSGLRQSLLNSVLSWDMRKEARQGVFDATLSETTPCTETVGPDNAG